MATTTNKMTNTVNEQAENLFHAYINEGEDAAKILWDECTKTLKYFEVMVLREKFHTLLMKAGKI